MIERADVAVVGGGVIGAACAHYLRLQGCSVVLIDRGMFGRGCSYGNCGYVCPSHVLPLASPGALWRTLKTLAMPNSPLRVRWRFEPALWRWFWSFARRCNQRDMLDAGRALQVLLESSRALYDELLAATLTDVEWQPSGLLFVCRSPATMEHYAHTDRLLRNEFDLPARRYDQRELTDFEPALLEGLAGGWFYEHDGQLRPDKLMAAWRRVLAEQGVVVRETCELLDLAAEGRRVRSLITSHGKIAADRVVIATGAWTPQLNRVLRCPIAIQPGKGYSITMPRPACCPHVPMIFEEHRVAVTPLDSAYRLGSTMEFAGYDDSLNPARIKLLSEGARLYLREPTAEPIFETWAGWRPMTPDGLPYIGPVPAFDNVHLAAGHGMLGVSMAPATGRLIADLLAGQTPQIDPHPFRVNRRI
jgi:D-amino-acid dehydrogenase